MNTKVSVGLSTVAGFAMMLGSALAAIYSGVKGNDTGLVTGGVVSILTTLTTIGGRMAQAVVLIRRAAPVVQAIAAGLDDIPGLEAEGVKADGPVAGSDG